MPSQVPILCLILSAASPVVAEAQWLQWGGPGRDFVVPETDIADAWPVSGPREVWSRELGAGHSGVVVDGGALYTLYGRGYEETVIAADTRDGRTLWEHVYEVSYQPEYREYQGPHATGRRLTRRDAGTEVREAWRNRRFRIMLGNAVRVGDRLYASIGDEVAFLAALDVGTGEELFRSRGFKKANVLWADERLVLLDEDGVLAVARPAAEGGLEVLWETEVLEYPAWTLPTIVGHRIYLRDARRLVALDLGSG